MGMRRCRDGLPGLWLLLAVTAALVASAASSRSVRLASSVADVSNSIFVFEHRDAASLRTLKQTGASSTAGKFCFASVAPNDGNEGEDPHRLALRENTALWQAAKDGDLPAVEAALDAGACLDVHVGKFGTTPLQEAAGAGHEHIVRFLLQRGADVNAQSSQGSTALFRAAIFRHGGVVRILAAEGADLEVRRGFDGATALVAAAAFVGNAEIVGVLIDVGADVDAANDAGSTALFLAAQHGDEETVAVLINGGADVDKARSNGATPLVIAAQEGTPGVIRLLLDAGADPTIANNFRTTPLHLTGFRLGGVGEEMAGMLLASAFNVDIDAMDEDGRTPLMWAARFGNAGVARFLLEEGADGSAVDGAGRSAAALVCTCVENEGDMAKLQCPSSGCELPATASEVLEALRQ